jgi:hypothetical protein
MNTQVMLGHSRGIGRLPVFVIFVHTHTHTPSSKLCGVLLKLYGVVPCSQI